MQYKPRDYNPEYHDRFKALSVNSPYAEDIRDGVKTIELRNQKTKYRGDLLICSTVNKKTKDPGQTLAFVELYEVKKVADLTPEELKKARVSEQVLNRFKSGYAWMLRKPRPVIEFPVRGQLGIWNLIFTKDTIMQYPTELHKYEEETEEERRRRHKFRRWVWLGIILIGILFWTAIFLLLF
jgi:hypothetical protein